MPTSPNEEVKKLVEKLEIASKLHQRGKAHKRTYTILNSDKKVNGWKFNEWDYGKNNITLPINARGLFISNDEENPRIVARGYDKFFNINETQATSWKSLEEETVGPYEVTVKSNGCIIFISALEDGTIVVCSKHSTGARDDVDRNHAIAGQDFLMKQFEERSIDPKVFAKELYNRNLTAIAEYCDDEFEEHILEYNSKSRGLYLHGLNLNEPEFKTLSMDEVHTFSQKYGFRLTESLVENNIHDLKTFLEKCASVGSFRGQEIEGFVIRCHMKNNGCTFFFKYKFEEPYLMYRQWREVTKEYIETKTRMFGYKKHKYITNKYLDFVIPLLDDDKTLCERYLKGFGIIKLRKMFLESYGMSGMEILNHEKIQALDVENATNYDIVDENTKFLIFPISVIGCGKTTTALTLTNLYKEQWGHIQNDDCRGKQKSMLIEKSLQKLSEPDVKCVFVDRNNHQYRERQQLFEMVNEYKEKYFSYNTNIKIIGVSFLDRDDLETVEEITKKRVLARGDNHQTIQLNNYGEKKVFGIMSGFWRRFQPVNPCKYPDSNFDLIINLKVSENSSSLNNTKEIISQIHKAYPVLISDLPTDAQIEEAFQKALDYKPAYIPKINKKVQQEPKIKKIRPTYFSAAIIDKDSLINNVKQYLSSYSDHEELCEKLNETNLQPEFHITLAHVAQSKNGNERQKKLWARYMKHYENNIKEISNIIHERRQKTTNYDPNQREKFATDGEYTTFKITDIYWDDRLMCAGVHFNMEPSIESCVKDKEGEYVSGLNCTNLNPHITLAIFNPDTKASYANTLCEKANSKDISREDNSVHTIKVNDGSEAKAEIYININ
ncbi:hypothetical protein C6P45_005125 [Maudiozyma exigua]|uniref:tRNA ligase n=1 Tax=Maudiozyma exigua TaxID=34358 RepID=A0A9P6WA34_MAUEX|nr:hypothetical protein C6P45_005125 [Kazachstania exigua]